MSRMLGGCVAASELIGLSLIFSLLGLHGGLWALPAFAPLLAWMLACAACRHTLRPAAFARLAGRARVVATALALAVLLTVWSSWSGPALAAWHGHGGGVSVGGYGAPRVVPSLNGFPAGGGGGGLALPPLPDPFPHLRYAAVIAASPALLAIVCVALLALGMAAMPGCGREDVPGRRGEARVPVRRREDVPARETVEATIVPAHVELASGREER